MRVTTTEGDVEGDRFLFRRGSTEFLPGHETALRGLATNVPPGATVVVHGLASEEGPVGYNRDLSQARADRTIEVLGECGVPESRVAMVVVHGEVPGDRVRNRASVVVVGEQPSTPESAEPVSGPAAEDPVSTVSDEPAAVTLLKGTVPNDLGVKVEWEFGLGERPVQAVVVKLKVKVSFEGVVTGPWPGMKVRQAFDRTKDKMKWELAKAWETESGKFTVKTGTDGKVGLEWGSKGSPLARLLGDKVTVEAGSPLAEVLLGKRKDISDALEVLVGRSFEKDPLALFGITPPAGVKVTGKLNVKAGLGLRPNPLWWAQRAATALAPEAVAGASALEVATGVALPLGMVAFVGVGLHQLNETHRRGREQAMRLAFARGYAEILAQLTNPSPLVPGGEELLGVDWRALLAMATEEYRGGSGVDFAAVEAGRIAGRAAVAQEVRELIESDSAGLARLGADHRRRYGTSEADRERSYRAILNAQALSGDVLGLPLRVGPTELGTPLPAALRTEMEDAFSREHVGAGGAGPQRATATPSSDRAEVEADQVAARVSVPGRGAPPLTARRPDFSGVRVHQGPEAARASRALGAVAYTVGQDVVIGTDVDLASPAGRTLLAHELTHVVQQQQADAPPAVQRQAAPAPSAVVQPRGAATLLSRLPPGNDAEAAAAVMAALDRLAPRADGQWATTLQGVEIVMSQTDAQQVRAQAATSIATVLTRSRNRLGSAVDRLESQRSIDRDQRFAAWVSHGVAELRTWGAHEDPTATVQVKSALLERADREARGALSAGRLAMASRQASVAERVAAETAGLVTAYVEETIAGAGGAVTTLEWTRNGAFLTVGILATFVTAGAAAGAAPALIGTGIGGTSVATTATVISVGAPIVANVGTGVVKASLGEQVDWGAIALDAVISIALDRVGARVSPGLYQRLGGAPTASLVRRAIAQLGTGAITQEVGQAFTVTVTQLYQRTRGRPVTWAAFLDELATKLTDPWGLFTTAVLAAAGVHASARFPAPLTATQTPAPAQHQESAARPVVEHPPLSVVEPPAAVTVVEPGQGTVVERNASPNPMVQEAVRTTEPQPQPRRSTDAVRPPGPDEQSFASLAVDEPASTPMRTTSDAAHEAAGMNADLIAGAHESAREVRTGAGVTGRQFESAHVLARTIGAAINRLRPGAYNPLRALATLLRPEQHRAFDFGTLPDWIPEQSAPRNRGWVQEWNRRAAANQRTTVADAWMLLRNAADAIPPQLMTAREKGTLMLMIDHEMSRTGLDLDAVLIGGP